MRSEPTRPNSEDKRKPRALAPYLGLWVCLAACAALAFTVILLRT